MEELESGHKYLRIPGVDDHPMYMVEGQDDSLDYTMEDPNKLVFEKEGEKRSLENGINYRPVTTNFGNTIYRVKNSQTGD